MSIVRRPQPCSTKYFSQCARISRSLFPGSKCSRKIQNPSVLMRTLSRTDSSSSSLFPARAVVADGHHVIEPVDADALAAHAVCEPVARGVDEHLVLDPRRTVLADV